MTEGKDVIEHLEDAIEYIVALEEAIEEQGVMVNGLIDLDDYALNIPNAKQAIKDLRNKYL